MEKSFIALNKLVLLCLILFYAGASFGFSPNTASPPVCNDSYTVPIIMYHATHRKNPGKYNVTPELLEEDFKFLKDNGYTSIFVKDLIDFQEKGIPLPQNPIMITFDDGCSNNYINAFPLMVKHQTKCIMSVVGKYIDDNYKDDEIHETKSHVTYEQIKKMSDSGFVEIQSHTYNMHNTNGRNAMAKKEKESFQDYEKALSDDLTKLGDNLIQKTGITCTAVAYPYGKYTKPDTENVLRKLDFKAAFTCSEGTNIITRDSNLFYLSRFNRPYGKSSKNFFKCLQ